MSYALFVSQGRIGDRTAGAIKGAALTAAALEPLVGHKARPVGTPRACTTDDWPAALREAKDTLDDLRDTIAACLQGGTVPVIAANTCSASLATLPLVAQLYPDAAILWVDAHGDFNTPATTGSGYLGGMVVAAACGLWDSGHGAGLRPEQVHIVGARDIDDAEGKLLTAASVQLMAPTAASPAAVLRALGDRPVWIHIDWDVLEPGFVPAAYSIAHGLTPTALRSILAALPREKILGIELAEFEASESAADNEKALAVLTEIVRPLFL